MKKTLLTALILTAIISPAMANGSSEKNADEKDTIRIQRQGRFDFNDLESVELEGKLILDNNFFPALDVDGEKWILMVHYRDSQEINLEDGMTVKVTGFEMPARRHGGFLDEGEKAIHVIAAVIDGNEYAFDEPGNGSHGMMGRGGKRGAGMRDQGFNDREGFRRGSRGDNSAIQELKSLYARGEITEEEYRKRLEVLREE